MVIAMRAVCGDSGEGSAWSFGVENGRRDGS